MVTAIKIGAPLDVVKKYVRTHKSDSDRVGHDKRVKVDYLQQTIV